MQKRQWLFIIVVAVLVWVIFDLALQNVDLLIVNSTVNVLGPAAVGGIIGVVTSIKASPLWINYGHWISFAIGGAIIGILFYFGHGLFNKIRGVAVRSAMSEAAYQSAPVVATPAQVIAQTPVKIAAPAPAPTPQTPLETAKEETQTA